MCVKSKLIFLGMGAFTGIIFLLGVFIHICMEKKTIHHNHLYIEVIDYE